VDQLSIIGYLGQIRLINSQWPHINLLRCETHIPNQLWSKSVHLFLIKYYLIHEYLMFGKTNELKPLNVFITRLWVQIVFLFQMGINHYLEKKMRHLYFFSILCLSQLVKLNNADLKHCWFLNGHSWSIVLNFASMIRASSYIQHFSLLLNRLQDVAGYGVALAVKDIYAKAFGERNLDSDLVDLMVKDGRQGILLNLLLLMW